MLPAIKLTYKDIKEATDMAKEGCSFRLIADYLEIPSTTFHDILGRKDGELKKKLTKYRAIYKREILKYQRARMRGGCSVTTNLLAERYVDEQKRNYQIEEARGIVGPINFIIKVGEPEHKSYKEVYGEEEIINNPKLDNKSLNGSGKD